MAHTLEREYKVWTVLKAWDCYVDSDGSTKFCTVCPKFGPHL